MQKIPMFENPVNPAAGYYQIWFVGGNSPQDDAIECTQERIDSIKGELRCYGVHIGPTDFWHAPHIFNEYLYKGCVVEIGEVKTPDPKFAAKADAPNTVTIIANTEERIRELAKKLKLTLEERVVQR